jgi:probable rRNA maturation factor
MTTLNARWRNIDRPTNVLSFPSWDGSTELYNGESGILLGDVVLARQTIEAEADGANLPPVNHVKHLVVHGVLHLLGFDHETEEEADIMEALEVKVLSNIGVASPYKDRKKENVI